MRRHVPIAAGLAMALIAAGCSGESGTSDRESIKIGVQIALSGDAAAVGKPSYEGMKFAVEAINDEGGVKVGDKSYDIELVTRDDKGDPDTARSVTEQLITQDKVDVIAGGVITSVTGPALVVAERYGVPMVTTFAFACEALPKNPKFTFANISCPNDQFGTPLAFFRDNGVKTVQVVATNDDLGQPFVDGIAELGKEYGLTFVKPERIPADLTDFKQVVARLQDSPADALMVEAGAEPSFRLRTAQVSRNLCKFKFSYFEYGPAIQPDWSDATKDAASGALSQASWWPTAAGGKDRWFGDNLGFVKKFRDREGSDPVWANAQGVQTIELLTMAIEKAGNLDKKSVADAFGDLSGSTLYGPVKFDDSNFNVGLAGKSVLLQQQGAQPTDVKVVSGEGADPVRAGSC